MERDDIRIPCDKQQVGPEFIPITCLSIKPICFTKWPAGSFPSKKAYDHSYIGLFIIITAETLWIKCLQPCVLAETTSGPAGDILFLARMYTYILYTLYL
jgi:hypothetical protein